MKVLSLDYEIRPQFLVDFVTSLLLFAIYWNFIHLGNAAWYPGYNNKVTAHLEGFTVAQGLQV